MGLAAEPVSAMSTVTTASVKDYGAMGDGVTDDTISIRNALASSHKAISVPPGTYKITGQIEIPRGKGLYGTNVGSGPRYVSATSSWDESSEGSVIKVMFGAGGESATNSAIRLNSHSVAAGLQFWYPSQPGSTTSPSQYPPTIALAASDPLEASSLVVSPRVEDCIFINPWIGMDFTSPHSLLCVRGIVMTAWKGGIRVDGSLDVDRLVDIHMNPNTSYRGPWPSNGINTYAVNNPNSYAFEFGQAVHIMIDRCFSYGFSKGLWAHPMAGGIPVGMLINQCGFEGTDAPVRIDGQFRRIVFTGCMFGTREGNPSAKAIQAIASPTARAKELFFVNCTIWRSENSAIQTNYVDHIRLTGFAIYSAVAELPAFSTPSVDVQNANGFFVSDSFIEAAPHGLVYYMNIRDCKGVSVNETQFAGSTSLGFGFDTRSIKGGRLRAFITGTPNIVYQLGNTDFSYEIIDCS